LQWKFQLASESHDSCVNFIGEWLAVLQELLKVDAAFFESMHPSSFLQT
jgi:hypothetical protein